MRPELQLFAKEQEPKELPVQQEPAVEQDPMEPLLTLLGRKYGLSSEGQEKPDPAALLKALEAEEQTASSLEARLSKLEQSYAAGLKAEKLRRQQARAKELTAKWQQQAQEAKALYPKLDLAQELKDPRFGELLKSGVDVRTAFEVIHKDEILCASMHYAAQEVERRLTNKLMAGSNRPGENGGVHGPSVSKVDVSRMTRQERRDIARRVRMGETITF
ncbi:MAG: hypothetical protein J6K89_08395 [Oscillospiraceae bacterium]|nr:hypothetical protein [Oscillospiraceae bacterium]